MQEVSNTSSCTNHTTGQPSLSEGLGIWANVGQESLTWPSDVTGRVFQLFSKSSVLRCEDITCSLPVVQKAHWILLRYTFSLEKTGCVPQVALAGLLGFGEVACSLPKHLQTQPESTSNHGWRFYDGRNLQIHLSMVFSIHTRVQK